jgi:hypothetical protein
MSYAYEKENPFMEEMKVSKIDLRATSTPHAHLHSTGYRKDDFCAG